VTTTDQAAPAVDDTQTAQQGRADAIAHLLFRAACGVLKAEEGALLRTLVEQQRDAGDSLAGGVSASAAAYARRYEKAARRLRKARAQRDEARDRADKAEAALGSQHGEIERLRKRLVFIAEAPLNVDVWARIGMALGWTPEQAGTEARKRRLHGEQQLAATADTLRQQLTAAKAEAEGLAETMRNTDRLTTQQLADTRGALRAEQGRADNLGAQFRDRRHALSQALGLGTSAPWDDITERARELHALTETAGTAVSASDVLERHDVTRKAMCDALGAGYHLNWQQIIDAAQRSHNANAAWQNEAERHRRTLAVVLDLDAGTEWSTIVQQAGAARAYRADWARCADEAERSAATDVAAARQAEEVAAREYSRRRQQLADALGCDPDTSWPDIAETARRMFEAGPVRRSVVVDAEQNASAARQAEAEAVRARQAAEAQRRDVVALLNDTEKQLGEARRKAEVWRVDAATQGQIVAQRTEERDRLREQRDWWKTRAHQAVAGQQGEPAADTCTCEPRGACTASCDAKVAERCCACGCPDVTYHNHREQPFCCRCAKCCEPPTLCAHGCQPPAETETTCPGCGHTDAEGCGCPTKPTETDGAELWAAIRDHAARDTAWWDRIEREHRSRPGRFPVTLQ
jgi:hypothetical protein